MSKLSLSLVLAFSASLAISFAYAGNESGEAPGTPKKPAITWQEFKDSCEKRLGNQIPPSNIRIVCTNVETEFVPSLPGQIPLPGTRTVFFELYSDKYDVVPDHAEVPVFNKAGSCLKYKEQQRTLSREFNVSCADVLGMKMDLPEFCTTMMDANKGAPSKAVKVEDTNRFIDTCSGTGIQASR